MAQIIIDLDEYKDQLAARVSKSYEMMHGVINKARQRPKRVVYPEGEHPKILRAAHIVRDEKIAVPILLGRPDIIRQRLEVLQIDLQDVEIIEPLHSPTFDDYCQEYYRLRNRRGLTMPDVREKMALGRIYATMMVHMGDADCVVAGLTMYYPETIRPALRIIQKRPDVHKVAGMHILIFKDGRILFCADTTVNIEPTAEDLAEITILTAETVRRFEIEPRIAMLSFSNFGSTQHPVTLKVKRAVELAKQLDPNLMVDGEMQADVAIFPEMLERNYAFSSLKGGANVLIFPNLESGNIAYRLLMRLGGAEAVGPILMGMRKSVHVLQRECEIDDIVNMTAVAVVEAHTNL